MKFILFILKLLLDAVRDTFKIVKHFNLIKHNNFLVIFKMFIIRFFFSFSSIRKFQKIKSSDYISKEIYFEDSEINVEKISNEIDNLGHANSLKLKKNYVEELKKLIFDSQNFDLKKISKNKLNLKKMDNESEKEYVQRLESLKISRLTGTINLNDENILKSIITSKSLIEIAKSYLNTNCISINATYFISNPIKTSEEEKYSNAQYFHWDNDFVKFFKFYIYLSDVDEFAGPHVFVPFSHKYKKKQHRLCRLYRDDKVLSEYKNIKYFKGPAGTSFFTDSYGLHKGAPPLNKHRLMLNIHFGKGKLLYSEDDLFIKLKK